MLAFVNILLTYSRVYIYCIYLHQFKLCWGHVQDVKPIIHASLHKIFNSTPCISMFVLISHISPICSGTLWPSYWKQIVMENAWWCTLMSLGLVVRELLSVTTGRLRTRRVWPDRKLPMAKSAQLIYLSVIFKRKFNSMVKKGVNVKYNTQEKI